MKTKTRFKIKNIDPDSKGESIGLNAGDCIVSINGNQITDIIDYYFYSSDNPLKIKFLKPNNKIIKVELEDTASLGLSFQPMQFKKCRNNCIFCFIDQNPPRMRKNLYRKDEDYRLSFLYGNYVTLTNATQNDLERIVKQKLSPLYVSIHAIQPSIRKKLFGIQKDDRILDKITFLTDNKIEIHAQIVLCPGINDGKILEDTIKKLSHYYPFLRTLAIVPVGLTKHRKNLSFIPQVNRDIAKHLVSQVLRMQKKFKKKIDNPFVFLADEFYLLSENYLPSEEHYGKFQQIDNGVGLTRHFINEFKLVSRQFQKSYKPQRKLILITGEMASPVIKKHILPTLNNIKGITADVEAVENKFYGKSVTVSGLLTGRDIIDKCSTINRKAEILLPTNCINNQGLFLDGLDIGDIKRELKKEVRIIKNVKDIV